MPPLTIPERHRPGIAAMLKLSPDQVDALVSTLSSRPAGSSASDLSRLTMPAISDATHETVSRMARALLSLYSVRARYDQSASSLADDIIESILTHNYPNLRIPDDEREEYREKLRKLLSVDSVLYRRKVNDVLEDHQFLYCSARILTDIRPVFGLESSDDIIDAGVTHNLKITYHEGERHREIYLKINDAEIQELRAVLDRAEEKSKRLRKLIDESGISHVE